MVEDFHEKDKPILTHQSSTPCYVERRESRTGNAKHREMTASVRETPG